MWIHFVRTGNRNFGVGLRIGAIATAIAGSTLAVREFIQAATEQEDAVNRLSAALKVNGEFTRGAINDFEGYAASLQNVTRFGDEAILNQLALAKSFGATNQQAKEIVTAATDLAAAFDIDLESATRNVAKTLGGFAGELGETIPALKNLTQEQLQAGEGITLLANQFKGSAQESVKTFSGATDQLANTFGDLVEEIGFFITKNDTLREVIEGTTGVLDTFGSGLRVIREELLGIGEVTDGFTIARDKLKEQTKLVYSLIDRRNELKETLRNLLAF